MFAVARDGRIAALTGKVSRDGNDALRMDGCRVADCWQYAPYGSMAGWLPGKEVMLPRRRLTTSF